MEETITANYRNCPTLNDYTDNRQKAREKFKPKTQTSPPQPRDPKPITSNYARDGISSSQITKNALPPQHGNVESSITELQKELRGLNELVNIADLLNTIKTLNRKLKETANPQERKTLALYYLLNING